MKPRPAAPMRREGDRYAAAFTRLLILAIVALEQPVADWMLFQDWPAAP